MKECLYCFEELTRRDDESPSQFKIRKYCNASHASKHNAFLRKRQGRERKASDSPWFYHSS